MGHQAKDRVYGECFNTIREEIRGKSFDEGMALVCSVLKEKIPYYFWAGFYIPEEEYGSFDEKDKEWLKKIAKLLTSP